jgi:hypothetical protein
VREREFEDPREGKRRAAIGLTLWFLLAPVALFFFGLFLFEYSSANS